MSGGAVFVATGILASRLAGLVRLRVFAHYFGVQSASADAFNAAFRIPNLLQNLFGEGALSASFIPVYAALQARGDRAAAERLAGAIGALLAVAVALVVAVGVLAAPLLVSVLAPGFDGETRALTTSLVRVLFPGAGLLAASAWCLGILNSHRRFLLSYLAPVAWNAAMIATLLLFGPTATLPQLALWLAWGSVIGSAAQFGVQLPVVMRLAPDLRFQVARPTPEVRAVLRGFGPSLVSRGIVQLSAFVDTLLASLLPTGALTGMSSAQVIYLLPVSLFGMSVAAAELPEMASASSAGPGAAREALLRRLEGGLQRVAFFIVPSAVAFFTLGDIVAGALLQTGRFRASDAVYVWGILAGSAVGLLPATLGRVYSSAFYAMRDTRTPLHYAVARIVLASALGYVAAVHGPGWLGIDQAWGAAGITTAAGVGATLEMFLLRNGLERRVGRARLARRVSTVLWLAAGVAGIVAWGVRTIVPPMHPIDRAIPILGSYGAVYLVIAWRGRVVDLSQLTRMLRTRPSAAGRDA